MSDENTSPIFDAVEFAKAIADETRQSIMQLLCCARLNVGDIATKTGVSQPTVSHHLAILRDAHLVTIERVGRETFYTLNQEHVTFCCGRLMTAFAPTFNRAHNENDLIQIL
jgi:DNA-binding transcriptional ArsR family regulator